MRTECLWDMLEDERAFIKSDLEWNRHGAISTLLRRLIAIEIQEITRDIQFSVWLSTAKMDNAPPYRSRAPALDLFENVSHTSQNFRRSQTTEEGELNVSERLRRRNERLNLLAKDSGIKLLNKSGIGNPH